MSEFEGLAGAIADVGEIIEDAKSIGGDASSAYETEIRNLTGEINDTFKNGTGFDLGLEVNALSDGEFQFKNLSGDIIENFDKKLSEFKSSGNLKKFLNDTDPELLNRLGSDPQAIDFLDQYQSIIKDRTGQINEIAKSRFSVNNPGPIQEVADIGDAGNNAITDAIANGESVTPEMVDEAVRDPTVDAQGREMASKLENASDPRVKQAWDEFKNAGKSAPAKFGKWVIENPGKIAVIGGIGAVAWMFYAMVKKHQNAMNGCWLVKKNGTKQKVSNLTCNKNDASNSGTGQSTTNYSCSRGCTSKDEGQCDTGCGSCQDANGGKYLCVNGSFPDAAADVINNAENAGGNIIENLLKNSLKFIGIGILVLIAVIILVMVFQFLIKKASEKRDNSGGNILDKIDTIKPSFRFRK